MVASVLYYNVINLPDWKYQAIMKAKTVVSNKW
jgi:hypothetical protein